MVPRRSGSDAVVSGQMKRRDDAARATDWGAIEAALFDLDGVLTPTAVIHERAWKTMFDDFLAARAEGGPWQPFSADDYLAYVDGKRRVDGVRSFLASRGVHLPEGSVDDEPGHTTVNSLGNAKNAAFQLVLRRDGIEPFPGSVRFLDALAPRGTEVAVVSSSRNAAEVLAAAGLAERFGVVVDGNFAAAHNLRGKPAPDTFLAAAELVGVTPPRAAVIEDAISGVAAGHAGGFGLVVGVDRGAGHAALAEHGADLVVDDLDELLDDVAADAPVAEGRR
jgi:beta-phosphoglucomutase family hydrolase